MVSVFRTPCLKCSFKNANCIILSHYAYLTSDTIESLANRTFEGIDIVCDETKTLTIWSLAME